MLILFKKYTKKLLRMSPTQFKNIFVEKKVWQRSQTTRGDFVRNKTKRKNKDESTCYFFLFCVKAIWDTKERCKQKHQRALLRQF